MYQSKCTLYRENSHRFTSPSDCPFFWHCIFSTVEPPYPYALAQQVICKRRNTVRGPADLQRTLELIQVFFKWALFEVVKIRFASGLSSLQYKAERLGWSGSLLLQTEAALISDYGREQTDYRYVLYMSDACLTHKTILYFQQVEWSIMFKYTQFVVNGLICAQLPIR